MTDGSNDSNKTRRLDDAYFKNIATRAKQAPVHSDGDKTQIVGQTSQSAESKVEGDKTQIYKPSGQGGIPTQEMSSSNPMDDPPTGWLVAINGPGKGNVLTLGIGNNGVGRGDEPRVPIPFDDKEISRGQSFSVVYDPKHRRYYLLPGSGKTLVYHEEQPVLERIDLKTGMAFQVGQTTFRFVALCDDNFDWE
ncbi:hypothetical protein OBB00_05350 [Gammaproteobacteria bacterium]|nr:hypothetical protein [Gammaproteobacteria bacterium]